MTSFHAQPPRSVRRYRDALRDLHAQTEGWASEDAFSSFVATAFALKDSGRYDAAIAVIDEAWRSFRDTNIEDVAASHNVRGQALQALQRFDEARAEHEEMLRLGESTGRKHIVGAARFALGSVAQLRGELELARQHYAIAFRYLDEAGDVRAQLQILLNLASIRLSSGDLDECGALLDSAGELILPSRDLALRGSWHGSRGNLLVRRGDLKGAEVEFRASLHDSRRAGTIGNAHKALLNLGRVNLDGGRPRRALRFFLQGLELGRSLNVDCGMVELHQGAGEAARQCGAIDVAAEHFGSALTLARKCRDVGLASRAAIELARIELDRDQIGSAQELLAGAMIELAPDREAPWVVAAWTLAIRIAGKSGEPREAIAAVITDARRRLPTSHSGIWYHILRSAGETLSECRYHEEAVRVMREAFAFHSRAATKIERAWERANFGAKLMESDGSRYAISFFGYAGRTFKNAGDRQSAALCINDMANALVDTGRYAAAWRAYSECLEIGRMLRDRAILARTNLNWGESLRRHGKAKDAIARLRVASKYYRQLGDKSGEAGAESCLGLSLKDLGQDELASHSLRKSERLARECHDNIELAVSIGGRADIEFKAGRYSRAAVLFRRASLLEARSSDANHEVESQVGLLRSLARLGDARRAKVSIDRIFAIMPISNRRSLISWGFRDAGDTALEARRDSLAATLFACWMAVAVTRDPSESGGAISAEELSQRVIRTQVQFHRCAPSRVRSLNAKVSAAAHRQFGASFGRLLRKLLHTGEVALRRAIRKGARSEPVPAAKKR